MSKVVGVGTCERPPWSCADERPAAGGAGARGREPDAQDPRGISRGLEMRVLAAESERADDGPIARGVLLHQVGEKATALTHELEEAAARMIVLREAAEVLCQVADPLGQERDLDLGRPGVTVLDGELGDDLLLLLPRERHSILRHERWRDCITSISTRGG